MSTETSPSNPQQAQFDRASALMSQREFRGAADILRGLLEQRPLLMPARFNLGLCHYALGEYSEAKRHLDACYQTGDRSPGLLRLIVSAYHHLGLIEEAVAIADQNSEPVPSDAAAAGVYALLYLDDGQAAKAQRWALRALKINPQSIDGLVVQATLRAAAMDTDGARAQYEDVLRRAPSTARAWVGLGTLDLLAQDFEQAKVRLSRGIELMPMHVGSWHVRAWTFIFGGDLDAAEADFRHALELDRNFAETHGGLASIAALRDRRVEAEKAIEIALRLDENCLSARFAQSVLLGQAGQAHEARNLIVKSVAGLSPKDGGRLSQIIEQATRG